MAGNEYAKYNDPGYLSSLRNRKLREFKIDSQAHKGGKDLINLGEKECRWPCGDKFCSAPVVKHKPYCERHCGIAYEESEEEWLI